MTEKFYSEMEYGENRLNPAKILAQGTFRGWDYICVNMGTHPTAYVRIPKESKFYQKHYDTIEQLEFYPHGHFTFSDMLFSSYFDRKITDGWYLGWDYGHAGDYRCPISLGVGNPHNFGLPYGAIQHSTDEMIGEAHLVIIALQKRENEVESAADEAQETP